MQALQSMQESNLIDFILHFTGKKNDIGAASPFDIHLGDFLY